MNTDNTNKPERSTFTSQLPRDVALQLGVEAKTIGECASYVSPSGKTVDISTLIQRAVTGTVSYPPDLNFLVSQPGPHKTRFEITNETTLSAARRLLAKGLRTVVLNFASATSPGGGFLSGARAQEEYLARSSALYECLRNNPMYSWHRNHWNPCYSDYMIYSPDVPVIRNDDGLLLEQPYTVNVITAAAVNAKKVAQEHQVEIQAIMWTRILKVLALGIAHHNEAFVLGAWGCGAFGCDANQIASQYRHALAMNFCGAYREIVFAIVDWSTKKRFIGPFENAFSSLSSMPFRKS